MNRLVYIWNTFMRNSSSCIMFATADPFSTQKHFSTPYSFTPVDQLSSSVISRGHFDLLCSFLPWKCPLLCIHHLHQSAMHWPTELAWPSTALLNHPLKTQIGTPSNMEAHQLVLLFLLSQLRRPGQKSWSFYKVHICIFHQDPTATMWVDGRKRNM